MSQALDRDADQVQTNATGDEAHDAGNPRKITASQGFSSEPGIGFELMTELDPTGG